MAAEQIKAVTNDFDLPGNEVQYVCVTVGTGKLMSFAKAVLV